MGRNLFILSVTLLLFSVVSCGMQWSAGMSAGGNALPGDVMLWRTVALVLLVGALVAGVLGMMATMFGQVTRRERERAEREGRYGR
jgi:hypothetical protein